MRPRTVFLPACLTPEVSAQSRGRARCCRINPKLAVRNPGARHELIVELISHSQRLFPGKSKQPILCHPNKTRQRTVRGGEEISDRSAGRHRLIRGTPPCPGGGGWSAVPSPPRSAPSHNSGTAMSSLSARRVSGTRGGWGARGESEEEGQGRGRAGAASLSPGSLESGSCLGWGGAANLIGGGSRSGIGARCPSRAAWFLPARVGARPVGNWQHSFYREHSFYRDLSVALFGNCVGTSRSSRHP